MSMLMLTGTLINVFQTTTGVNKEGKEYGGKHKLQMLGSDILQNGETQNKLIDLTCHDVKAFERFVGQQVTVPVGAIPSGKQVIFFVPKGGKPEVAEVRSPV